MKKYLVISLLISSSILVYAQEDKKLTQEEKERSVINYSNIKKILQNDGLTKEKENKEKYVKAIKKERKKISNNRYNYPNQSDYWALMSEYWLVKKAQVLRWDFPKPEYGIGIAFRQLLEKFGYYNKNFKVLIVNTPTVTHFGLPAGKNEFIFILSLPFIRSLDLTKVDISLLLLEDFLRIEEKYFIKNLNLDQKFLGTNFKKLKLNNSTITNTVKKYSEVIFEKGFNFQQQYEITKKMDVLLKSEPPLWGAYFKLYNKLDRFIKADVLYKNYLRIYPSPELQLQWLSPKKKVI